MNSTNLVGRLTRDVEVRFVPNSGTKVCNFTIAVDRDFTQADGTRGTDFIDIQVWNKQADSCENYLRKGHLVSVQGAIRIDSYTDQMGTKRRSFRINANRVQFLTPKGNTFNNNNEDNGTPSFEPNFEVPQGLDPNGFQALDDEEIPF